LPILGTPFESPKTHLWLSAMREPAAVSQFEHIQNSLDILPRILRMFASLATTRTAIECELKLLGVCGEHDTDPQLRAQRMTPLL
jgi:hypothetical protein